MARANRRVAGDRTPEKPAPDDIGRKALEIDMARRLTAVSELVADRVSWPSAPSQLIHL